jgi:hypothetical protein
MLGNDIVVFSRFGSPPIFKYLHDRIIKVSCQIHEYRMVGKDHSMRRTRGDRLGGFRGALARSAVSLVESARFGWEKEQRDQLRSRGRAKPGMAITPVLLAAAGLVVAMVAIPVGAGLAAGV